MKRLLLAVFISIVAMDAAAAVNCAWQTAPANMTITTAYNVFGTDYSQSQSFSFMCKAGLNATLTMDMGTYSSAYDPRTAQIQPPAPACCPTAKLTYNLLTPSNEIWGDGNGNSRGVVFAASKVDKIYNAADGAIIRAIAYGAQDVPPGTFSSTITATLAWDGPQAGSSTAQFTVTAIVIPMCTVDNSFTLDFGTYYPVGLNQSSPLDAQLPSASKISVRCTRSTAATIALSPGLHADPLYTPAMPRMVNLAYPTTEFLQYRLYRDAAGGTIWDDKTTYSAVSTSKNTPLGPLPGGGFVLYGRIFASQDPRVGTYRDTVAVNVNY